MPMISFNDYSFQGKEVLALRDQIEHGRLVHALLITGEQGTGKRSLAMLLSAALMCTAGKNVPCGKCNGCRMAESGEHPDITVIEKGVPLSSAVSRGRSTIPVDDIREMIRLSSHYAYEGGNRAVVIADAENLTIQAQNCLLKILEEPPQNTYYFLTSAHPEQILITVRSRCRPIRLIPWDNDYIIRLLTDHGSDRNKAEKAAAASAGSIGKAFSLISDDEYWKMREEVMNAFFRTEKRSEVLKISNAWKDRKGEADSIFSILEEQTGSLLRYRLHQCTESQISVFPAQWRQFAASAPLERFSVLSDRIIEARRQNSFNVNFQVIIEQLLLSYIGESDLWIK